MKQDCNCKYCKNKVDEYFCISCGYNFNECESNYKHDGVTFCPKCVKSPINEKIIKIRCKCCSELCESTKSIHVCDKCYPLCVSNEPLNCKPK